jgi:hypothetical protein
MEPDHFTILAILAASRGADRRLDASRPPREVASK